MNVQPKLQRLFVQSWFAFGLQSAKLLNIIYSFYNPLNMHKFLFIEPYIK